MLNAVTKLVRKSVTPVRTLSVALSGALYEGYNE